MILVSLEQVFHDGEILLSFLSMSEGCSLQFEILSVFPLGSKQINKSITSFSRKEVNKALKI